MNAITEEFKPLTSTQLISTALLPKNLEEALRLSDILAKSDIVPKDYQGKPGNVLVAIQWGMEIGLAPLQALQNIACINGRPSIWGDAMLALVRGSGLLDAIHEEVTDDMATCTVKRRGANPVTRTFSMADAKKAGLAGKSGPWQQYPKRMMQMRARSLALRDEFTDVLKGIASAEEAQDEKDMGAAEVVERSAPQSRTDGVKDKLRGKRSEAAKPDHSAWVNGIKAKLAGATNNDGIKAVKAEISAYSDGDAKAQAWEHYKARVTELKAEADRRQAEAAPAEPAESTTQHPMNEVDLLRQLEIAADLEEIDIVLDVSRQLPEASQQRIQEAAAKRKEALNV